MIAWLQGPTAATDELLRCLPFDTELEFPELLAHLSAPPVAIGLECINCAITEAVASGKLRTAVVEDRGGRTHRVIYVKPAPEPPTCLEPYEAHAIQAALGTEPLNPA